MRYQGKEYKPPKKGDLNCMIMCSGYDEHNQHVLAWRIWDGYDQGWQVFTDYAEAKIFLDRQRLLEARFRAVWPTFTLLRALPWAEFILEPGYKLE